MQPSSLAIMSIRGNFFYMWFYVPVQWNGITVFLGTVPGRTVDSLLTSAASSRIQSYTVSSRIRTASRAPVVGIEFTIERERRLVPVVETNCWELRPCFSP